MMEIKGKHTYFLAPHVLQRHLNQGEDQFIVDFGDIKAVIKIEGKKSSKPIEIEEAKKNEVNSSSRSQEGSDEEVRKAPNQRQGNGTTSRQKAKVAQ